MKFLTKNLFLIIFLSSFAVYLSHTVYTKTSIFADGRFYFVITRSLVKDHDIKFANEYSSLGMDKAYTYNGYSWNKYPPGVSLFWIPAFLEAEGLNNLLHIFTPKFDASGFNNIHQAFVALDSIFLGTLGLYLLYSLLNNYFPKKISLLTVFFLFSSTNLLFYIAVEPINSHSASFFTSSLFLYYFLRYQKDKYYYLILGIIIGVAGLIRTQDILLLVLPIIKLIKTYKYKSFEVLAASYFLLATGAFISFLPQIYFWKKIFNTFLYSPYLSEGVSLLKPQIFHVLFNAQNGLFTTTPIVLISIAGLFIIRKYKLIRFYALLYFTIQIYLISSWSSFFQGGSFGIRMAITTYPLLSFGLAQIVSSGFKVLKEKQFSFIIIGFFALNCFNIINYLLSY